MNKNQSSEKFNFFIPASFEKGKRKGKEVIRVKGIASTSTATDSDGEILHPDGFDCTPLLTKGFLNWDHQQKGRPSAIIGEPDVARIQNDGKDLYIEGFLYPDSKEAQECAELAQVLEANSATRRLGYSIEGQVIERGSDDKNNPLYKKVIRARITGVAITPCPKNPNTLLSLMKGEYSEQFVDEDEEESPCCPECECPKSKCKCDVKKAMSAEGASEIGLIPEHIEGMKNPNKAPLDQDKEHAVGRSIKKSEVYNLIAKNYTTDLEKAVSIFNLIKSANQKLYNMQGKEITQEAIDAAFDFLNKAVATDISKGEDMKYEKEEDDNDEDDKMKKAKEMCKSLRKGGKSNDEAIEEMIKGGFSLSESSTAAATVAAEMSNLTENGGQVAAVTPTGGNTDGEQSLKKSEVEELFAELTAHTDSLVKGIGSDLNTNMDNKFESVGKILKHTLEQNTLLKSELDSLRSDFGKKITNIEKEAQPLKSTRSVGAMERFAKSENASSNLPVGTNVYNLNSREDRDALGDIMQGQIEKSRSEGVPASRILEQAISELEIAKSIPPAALPMLRAMNIAVEKK